MVSGRSLTWPLCAIFAASGASALIFENLWFREAARLLGNSVWATSIVLASFMGGLALGGGIAGRLGHRITRLIRVYGLLELAIAVSGGVVIVVLPNLSALLAPVFRALAPSPLGLAAARLVVAFALMLVPAAAMGATLPILVTALCRWDADFARALGRLYGWNTLGAVAGILAVELVLVSELGIRGAAAVAVMLNLGAGGSAIWLARRVGALPPPPSAAPDGPDGRDVPAPGRMSWTGRRVLASAFLCGALLLALEVVWMRFLALYVLSTSVALSLMLAVILTGIAVGGLAASRLRDGGQRWLQVIALAAGVLALGTYVAFPSDRAPGSQRWQDAITAALRLALPVSVASGALFTTLGDAAKRQLAGELRSIGLFVVANTIGAMLGALVAGFALIPALGMEGSLFVLGAGYGVVALCVPRPPRGDRPRRDRAITAAAALALVATLATFPFGRMMDRHLPQVLSPVASPGAEVVAYREGLTATLALVGFRWGDEVFAHQLFTNGFSMSSSLPFAQRYMKMFVYWPVAVRPAIERALLICYGVGQTAKALTDTAGLRHIDVVDISRDILALGRAMFAAPAAFPLDDPRVDVHIEDGRFFLQTTVDRYDLITGEPPPPQVAGVVDLYTKEYFELVRARLTDGGVTTYWLPVHELSVSDAQVIMRAFCDVFADCSLWSGDGFDWMLVGTRDLRGGATEDQLAAQWRVPTVARELAALGLEHVEQLGATFIADGPQLRAMIGDAPPVDDDHPDRLGHHLDPPSLDRFATFVRWMNPDDARARFASSELIARLWPAALRARTLPLFAAQRAIDLPALAPYGLRPLAMTERIAALRQIQSTTDLRTPVVWLLDLSQRQLDILERAPADAPGTTLPRAVRALADRRYAEAAQLFTAVTSDAHWTPADLEALHAYAASMAGSASPIGRDR